MHTSNALIISAMLRAMGVLDLTRDDAAGLDGAGGVGSGTTVGFCCSCALALAVLPVPLFPSSASICCSMEISASSSSAARLAISRRFLRFLAVLLSLPEQHKITSDSAS